MIKNTLKKSKFLREKYKVFMHLKTEVPAKETWNIKKIKQFLLCRQYSMNNWPSLSTIYELAREIKRDEIRGDVVECGCCNGGAGAMSTKFLSDRTFWLFDSFEGLPKPNATLDIKADDGVSAQSLWVEGWDKGEVARVKELYFKKLHLDENKVKIIHGLFEDTVPKYKEEIGKIALLHLDGDWYSSTKVCIESLYDQVEIGGYIVVDDYGHWKGCKQAIDEFLKKRNIMPKINKVDYSRIFFRKE